MTLCHNYTAIQTIASIITSTFMLVFFIIIPIVKAEKNARNKRAFKKWREDHGQPYYGDMEEETEMDLWEVEYPCDHPSAEWPTKSESPNKTTNNMKVFLKKYWASITLFALAIFAIAAIFIWPDQKDAFTAFIAVSIPTAILSIEMRKNKDQFNATIELDRINQFRKQCTNFIEALNKNDFILLSNNFKNECKLVQNGSTFNANDFFSKAKSMSDNLNHEWLKLKMLIPNDKQGELLINDIKNHIHVYFNSLIQFQIVLSYMDNKKANQMILKDFVKHYKEEIDRSIQLGFINPISGCGNIPNSNFSNYSPQLSNFDSIFNFALTILDEPIKYYLLLSVKENSNEKTLASKVQKTLYEYCNSVEKTLLTK